METGNCDFDIVLTEFAVPFLKRDGRTYMNSANEQKMVEMMDELITRSTFDSDDTRSMKQQNRNDKAADIRSRAKLLKDN